MKPLLLDVNPLLINRSLFVKEIKTTSLQDQVHFHNGYEIALILKGRGKRVVGDHIEHFGDNDLIFIGPFLPHVTYNNYEDDYKSDSAQPLSAMVVYFHPNWFAKEFIDSSDYVKVNDFVDKMSRGVEVLGETKRKAIKSLLKLRGCTGLIKTIKLWEILYFIAESAEYQCLASEGYIGKFTQKGLDRLDRVYDYVMTHYEEDIKLDDIAAIAHMTTAAFCKYFKSKTGKTFSNFVNGVRIGQSCKLLGDRNLSISEICYACGFNNLTSFNRNFRDFIKMTPTEYRKSLAQ